MTIKILPTKFRDDHRLLYRLISKEKEFILKIYNTYYLTESEEKSSRVNGKRNIRNIQEIEVYNNLKDDEIVEYVYGNRNIGSHFLFLNIEKESIFINFRSWVLEFNLQGPFTAIVTRRHKGFISLKYGISKMKYSDICYYFIKIMQKINYLNRTRNFVHGDLLTQNVLIRRKTGEIKLFDFDVSTIDDKVSLGQIAYGNFQKIYPLQGHKGFLFDFCRLYLAILCHTNGYCIFRKKYKVINDLVYLFETYNNKNIDPHNDTRLFCEWIQRQGKALSSNSETNITYSDIQHNKDVDLLYYDIKKFIYSFEV